MMTPADKMAILKRLEDYTDAWEHYVQAISDRQFPVAFKRGMRLTETKEALIALIKELTP
jgi:hypothetical protein